MRLRFTAATFATACTPSPLVSRTLPPAVTPNAFAADCATITPSSSNFREPALPASEEPSIPVLTGCNVTIAPKSDSRFSGTVISWMLALPPFELPPFESPAFLPASSEFPALPFPTVRSPDSTRTSSDDVTRPSEATLARISSASESPETTIRSYW